MIPTILSVFLVFAIAGVSNADYSGPSNYYLPPVNDIPCAWVKSGRICGMITKTRNGRSIATYKGIPYARPPVGNLRFKEPEEPYHWNGILNATKEAPLCIQKNYLYANPQVEGQEDCLYLNVYTPEVQSANAHVRTRYPVMFYIHGGGWFSGGGTSYLHGPEYLLDEEVILVTINYRLAIMGFFSTSDDVAPGNWAFRDMIFALKWVQNNIDSFGGDPNSVTIFGESAGAGSVHHLMLTPQAKGLFHKVIAQSGSALNLWATPINHTDIVKAQASFVGCPANGTNQQIVDCLRKVDAKTLIESGDKFKFWSVEPLVIYIPALEKKTDANPNPIIEDYPANIIKQGRFNPVPFMIGVMENEGILRASTILTHKDLRDDWNKRWDVLPPQLFLLAYSTPNATMVPQLWNNLTEFYMKGQKSIDFNNSESIQNFVDLYSDRMITYGSYQSAKKHAQVGLQSVYYYKINFAGRDTWSHLFAAGGKDPVNYVFNKSHCDELNWLFRIPIFFPEPFPAGSLDEEMSRKIVKMWTNFATSGKPAGFWQAIPSTGSFNYLDIENPASMSMKSDFLTSRMNFWEKLNILENYINK